MLDSSIWIDFNCSQKLRNVYGQVLDYIPYLVFTIVKYFLLGVLIFQKVDQICRTKYTQSFNACTDADRIQSRVNFV